MKVVLLSDGSSIHTIRWANGLADKGVEVVLVSQHKIQDSISTDVRFIRLPYSGMLGYFRNVSEFKKLLATENPDILNVHYASGYGTTAQLAGFQPSVLSVWGSDVYSFPHKTPLHRWWMRRNLMAAFQVASTSHAMAHQVRSIAPALSEIKLTPFGVDMSKFQPRTNKTSLKKNSNKHFVIGTVKTLKPAYGIDILLEAFALLIQRLNVSSPEFAQNIILRIVGDGPNRDNLQCKADVLGIANKTEFVKAVPHNLVPDELHKLDIYVALSRQESFGVAVVEASACGIPVVVSDVGGLPEVVVNGETGYVVPCENPEVAAEMLEKLVLNKNDREMMGLAGRTYVQEHYDWNKNVEQMIAVYEQTIKKHQLMSG